MGTMAERPEERLIEFLADTLGDDLRAVYRDDPDDLVQLWPPDGPAPAEQAVLDRCLEAAHRFGGQAGGTPPALAGGVDGFVGIVDERVVVWLPVGREGGYVVTVDRRADHPMTGFVESCLAALR